MPSVKPSLSATSFLKHKLEKLRDSLRPRVGQLCSKWVIADNNLEKSKMFAEMYAKTSGKTNYSENVWST